MRNNVAYLHNYSNFYCILEIQNTFANLSVILDLNMRLVSPTCILVGHGRRPIHVCSTSMGRPTCPCLASSPKMTYFMQMHYLMPSILVINIIIRCFRLYAY